VNIELVGLKSLLLARCYMVLNRVAKFRDELAKAEKFEKVFK
jgi:hypothetical protein